MRALGINAGMAAAVETAYGTPPAANYFKLAMVSSALGEEQPLIEDDQLGFGREGLDPTYDVITNDGDVTVPVNTRGIGFWLRQTFGPPVTVALAGAQAGLYQHTFSSGAQSLPSTSVEISNPEVPSFSMNYGAVVNQLKIGLARSGMLNAALSLVAKGEVDPTTASVAGALTTLAGQRFAQATGAVTLGGAALGNVTTANVSYTNNIDKVENISPDGRISGVDPGVARAMGDVTIRFADQTLLSQARSKTPVTLGFGWVNGTSSLTFTLPRVFLPKPKRSITGPKGILATFNFQASGQLGAQLTAVLVNDVASYA